MFICLVLIVPMALISQSQLGQTIYGKETWDFFGHEVESSADGEIVAIGSSGNDEGGEAAGQVRIFKLGPSGKWLQMGSDINGIQPWRQVEKLTGVDERPRLDAST